MPEFKTILADPPWQQPLMGKRKRSKGGMAESLPYPTMTLDEIKSLPINSQAAPGCHLWLWTTNAFLRDGFDVMQAWGFKYLAPIHWIKPTGTGNYVIHRSQTLLLGYKSSCIFAKRRYFPNVFPIPRDPKRHSEKPIEFYELIESVSDGPRLELFARNLRSGWEAWGNEIESTVEVSTGGDKWPSRLLTM